MDDEMHVPIAMQPEDLFNDLREQTTVARLAEGLLCYTDLGLASLIPATMPEADEVSVLSD